jgi:CBS-domain-containing membrane protein
VPPRLGRQRFDLKGELALAALPATAVLVVFGVVEHVTRQRLLFASLASSAFLIYLDPQHATNQTRTLVIAQLTAAVAGYATLAVIGPGYWAAASAMVIITVVMIYADVVHPPAVGTGLAFAFKGADESNLMLFIVCVGMVAILVALERTVLWQLARATRRLRR